MESDITKGGTFGNYGEERPKRFPWKIGNKRKEEKGVGGL